MFKICSNDLRCSMVFSDVLGCSLDVLRICIGCFQDVFRMFSGYLKKTLVGPACLVGQVGLVGLVAMVGPVGLMGMLANSGYFLAI